MPSISAFIYPLTVAFCCAGIVIVMALARLQRRKNNRGPSPAAGTFEMECTVCQRSLVIHRSEVVELLGPEIALVVSTLPSALGRKLGEYRCPYCDASHCFDLGVKPMKWLVANVYEPQALTSHCTDCRKPLKKPSWPEGAYDGQIGEAPELLPEHGLICSRCKAVCCLECCNRMTRNRTHDGSLLCPRCGRGPVDKVFHF